MQKIWLIIKREYLTRVRKRTFIISTVLFPLLYAALIFGSGYIASRAGKGMKIALIDSSGYFTPDRIARENAADSSTVFTLVDKSPATMEAELSNSPYDGFVVLPSTQRWEDGLDKVGFYTKKTIGFDQDVSQKLNRIWNNVKNEKMGIDPGIVEKSRVRVLSPVNINDRKANSGIATTIGMVSAFLIYIILMLYGSQVMMGVTEEKTSRIAEVIVSSVKPFQLMIGKIIGIGMVAFTQILLWVTFMFVLYNLSSIGNTSSVNSVVGGVQEVFQSTNVPLLLFFFLFYMLGGFFFYASLFAALGSAVNEDMREAQSLSFPVMMPIIFSMVMMTAIIKDPSGPIAFWGSMIPFTSPTVMMGRIAFGIPSAVPWWQVILSMSLLIGGFVFTTWFASRIYRTGILMYGKKPSWKEMIKWAFRK